MSAPAIDTARLRALVATYRAALGWSHPVTAVDRIVRETVARLASVATQQAQRREDLELFGALEARGVTFGYVVPEHAPSGSVLDRLHAEHAEDAHVADTCRECGRCASCNEECACRCDDCDRLLAACRCDDDDRDSEPLDDEYPPYPEDLDDDRNAFFEGDGE